MMDFLLVKNNKITTEQKHRKCTLKTHEMNKNAVIRLNMERPTKPETCEKRNKNMVSHDNKNT